VFVAWLMVTDKREEGEVGGGEFGKAKCKTCILGENKIKQENNYFWVEKKVV
jgi:hypothetical protein